MISPISSSFSNLKSFSFITNIMLTQHNWWSSHYKCSAALRQNWGCSAGTTSILTSREVRDPLRKKTALSRGKTEKNLSQFFLRLANTYKKYILQKNWVKTVIPALSSGRSNLQRPIWGCHRQLDDRDHLVGQLTIFRPTFRLGPFHCFNQPNQDSIGTNRCLQIYLCADWQNWSNRST